MSVAALINDYICESILTEGKGYKGYGISYVGSGSINLANQYDTDAGSFFVKTNMCIQCSDCQMVELWWGWVTQIIKWIL